MSFLLDTCVISELVAKQPNPAVVQWVDSIDENMLFLSAITIGEIKRGIEKLPDSSRKSALEDWLEGALLIRFKGLVPLCPLVLSTGLLPVAAPGCAGEQRSPDEPLVLDKSRFGTCSCH